MAVTSFLRIISIIGAIVGGTFLLPIGVGVAYHEYAVLPAFIVPMVISWLCAAIIFLLWRKQKITISLRGAFVVVAGAWIFVSAFGAVPLFLSGAIPDGTDAFFESVSGISTTGATIVGDIESLPVCINLWRCELNWLGGMGIVALTVALLPLLGVGGFQLIKAETTGPEKGKITPTIAATAKTLWFIYIIFTVVQTVLLMICGMSFVDAISHAFSSLGTGGFSTKNASLGAFHSTAINVICAVFMILAGMNFSLYYYMVRGKFSEVWHNSELRAYIGILCVMITATTAAIIPQYTNFRSAFHDALFHVTSILTTTGLTTVNYEQWAPAARFLLFLLYFLGGCSGSTAGGVKIIRWVVLRKQVHNETERMLHPHGVFSIRLNQHVGRKDIVFSVASFFALYIFLVLITACVGTFGNLDPLTALTGALAMVGNVGPGFGHLGPAYHYGFLPAFVKWWYCFAMLAGRLELYTMLIFFMPAFWKK
ncbi:MAG: TrkH family potassium uptake protein [Treponema sp.]|nr:TrkH family potassium uptake protein [Treponema sp.]